MQPSLIIPICQLCIKASGKTGFTQNMTVTNAMYVLKFDIKGLMKNVFALMHMNFGISFSLIGPKDTSFTMKGTLTLYTIFFTIITSILCSFLLPAPKHPFHELLCMQI